jgi:integrase
MRGTVKQDAARKTWFFVIDNGIDPATGRRRQLRRRGFKTKKAAEDALKALLGDMRDGDYVEPSNQPLRVYLEAWLKTVEATRKPSTAGMYAHKMRRYVIPRIGAMRLRQIDGATLDALYAELRISGGRHDKNGEPSPLSEQTVAVVHRILHRAMSNAVKRGLIRSNPATVVEPPRSSAPRSMQVWDSDQMRHFHERTADDRLRALWVLAATTGLRRGEVCGLMWSDLTLDAGQAAIRRSRVPVAGKVVESTPKSGRARVITLAPATVAAVRKHRKAQLAEKLAWGAGWNETGYVFIQEDGKPLRPDWLLHRFDELVAVCDLPRIGGFHGLRHSFATIALAANVHPKVVQEILGHANVGITLDLYSHVVPGMQAEATARVAAMFLGS